MESLVKENKMPRYCVFAITPSSEENICNQIKLMGLKVHKLDPRKGKLAPVVNCKDNCVNVVFHDHLDDLHEKLKEISSEAFFLFDEVHYMFGNSKRSSVALELAKVCNMFIAMTGTLVRNKDIQKDHIIDWLGQVVDFEITSENYMIGVASLVSGKKELPIKQTRVEVDVPILDASYYNYVDSRFGGQSNKVDYFRAASICFESVYEGIKNRVLYHRELNHGCIFVVVKDKTMQRRLHDDLTALCFKCFSVGSGNSISIQTDSNPEGYEVVITTPKLETGYDVTAARYMITAPYPSNEASRTQLVGRIVRLSQKSSEVYVETLHCGILSYSMKHHEVAREISKSLSGMQKEV
jgi:superfamily II DNA or RNA helicase